MDKLSFSHIPQRFQIMTAHEFAEYVTINFRNLGIEWMTEFLREVKMEKDPAQLLHLMNHKAYPGDQDAFDSTQLTVTCLNNCSDIDKYKALLDDLKKLERKYERQRWNDELIREAAQRLEHRLHLREYHLPPL